MLAIIFVTRAAIIVVTRAVIIVYDDHDTCTVIVTTVASIITSIITTTAAITIPTHIHTTIHSHTTHDHHHHRCRTNILAELRPSTGRPDAVCLGRTASIHHGWRRGAFRLLTAVVSMWAFARESITISQPSRAQIW